MSKAIAPSHSIVCDPGSMAPGVRMGYGETFPINPDWSAPTAVIVMNGEVRPAIGRWLDSAPQMTLVARRDQCGEQAGSECSASVGDHALSNAAVEICDNHMIPNPVESFTSPGIKLRPSGVLFPPISGERQFSPRCPRARPQRVYLPQGLECQTRSHASPPPSCSPGSTGCAPEPKQRRWRPPRRR